MIQNAEDELIALRERFVVQQPVNVDHVLGFFVRIAHRIVVDFLLWLFERFGLPFDLTLFPADGGELKIIQVFIHDFQTIVHIIITTEVNSRVSGMVESLVEFGELFKREIRNHFRVTATVHTIRVFGEDGSL